MNIVVLVRTRNEAHRIEKFCEAYKDADAILVADGSSDDNTVELAKQFPNVVVRNYPVLKQMDNGLVRNPDGPHVNFLIEWSRQDHPNSFCILDDVDMLPNKILKEGYRNILETTTANFVHVVALYLWGHKQHFPQMSKPSGEWEPSLWAWRNNIDFKMIDVPPAFDFSIGGRKINDLRKQTNNLDIFPPMCRLHMSWDDPERVKKKVEIYQKSGLIPGMKHPLDFAGSLEALPEWAIE